MRIISGKFKGCKLTELKGREIRPTSDRIREALFNILSQKVNNAVVLDLFAGTGAFGIEALSRGAERAFFVDRSKQAIQIINKNISLVKIEEGFEIFLYDVLAINKFKTLCNHKFDLIFMDPPYGKGIIFTVFENIDFVSIMKDDSILIAEHSVRENIEMVLGLDLYDKRTYGETLISFFKKTSNN